MIAGIDIGPALTGWCVGSGADTPLAGAWAFPDFGVRYGALVNALDVQVNALFDQHAVTSVAYEAAILRTSARGGRFTDNLHWLTQRLGMDAHLEWMCEVRGIPCKAVDLRLIKGRLAGDAHASKADMVKAAVRLGVALPAKKDDGREDAADAFGAWLWGVHEFAPNHLTVWDQRLLSRRGGLL